MRRSRFLVIALLVVMLAFGGVFVWRWRHRGPSEASVGGAVGRFRTSSTVPVAGAPLVPPAGVYVYKGGGSESLSFLTTRQGQGPTMPGTVQRVGDACWRFRIDFNSFHHQEWTRCVQSGSLFETGSSVDQRFDFVAFKMSEHTDVACRPPVLLLDPKAHVGSTSTLRCSAKSTTTNASTTEIGSVTFVGREQLVIGTQLVAALHVREQFRTSGDQIGTTTTNLWFAADSGLLLAETHDIQIVSPAPKPLNHVTYIERGNWRLTAMTPRT